MRPLRHRSSLVVTISGKTVVLVLLLAVLTASAPAQSLDRAEAAWRDLERGGSLTEAQMRGELSARTRWLADTALRELEETDPAQAMATYNEQLRTAESVGDSVWVLVALERLAKLEIDAFEIAAARPRLERCRRLAEDSDQSMALALADLNLGRVLIRTREVDAAAKHLDAARTATRS